MIDIEAAIDRLRLVMEDNGFEIYETKDEALRHECGIGEDELWEYVKAVLDIDAIRSPH